MGRTARSWVQTRRLGTVRMLLCCTVLLLTSAQCVLDAPTAPSGDLGVHGDSVVPLGGSIDLAVTVPSAQSGPFRVVWTSSDTVVASVDSTGRVSGVAIGSAEIAARLTAPDVVGDVVGTHPVRVRYASIAVDPVDSLTGLGETRQLLARGQDVDGAAAAAVAAAFSSSDSSVVAVDAAGRVTARANGTVQISAAFDGLSAAVAVTVRQVAGAVSFVPAQLTLSELGRDTTVAALVRDTRDSLIGAPSVTWSSSDTSRVTVTPSGVIRAVRRGVAVITAQSDTARGELPVSVQPGVASLIVTGGGQTAEVGTELSVAPAVTVLDGAGEPLANIPVVFSIATGGGALTDSVQVSDSQGHATVGGWTLGTVAGPNQLRITAGSVDSIVGATGIAGPVSTSESVLSVSSDTVAAGSTAQLGLETRDAYGNRVGTGGRSVVLSVTGGSSTGSVGTTVDNDDGTYHAIFTGQTAGSATTVAASVDGEPVTSAAPTVVVVAGPAASVSMVSGDNQETVVGSRLPDSLVVSVKDALGNPAADVPVDISVVQGGGSVMPAAAITDGSGIAVVQSWTVGLAPGLNRLALTAGTGSATASATGTTPAVQDTVRFEGLVLGREPYAIAVNEGTARAYVANRSSGSVTVIDVSADSATDSVSVGGMPVGIAVHASANRVYVSTAGPDAVTVLDGATLATLATIPLWDAPAGVAIDTVQNAVYVALPGSDSVAVIDAATNAVTDTVAVGSNPQWLAVDATAGRLLVSNTDDGTVTVIDTQTGTVTVTLAVGATPRGLDVDEGRNLAYVTTAIGTVILSGASVSDTVPMPAGDYYGLAVNTTNNRIFVADALGDVVAVINGSSRAVSATVAVEGEPHGVAVHEGSATVLATGRARSTVTVFGTPSNNVRAVLRRVGGPRGVAVDEIAGRVYVANEESHNVSVLDGGTLATLGSPIYVGASPQGVAVNPVTARVYVANSGDGTLTVINATTRAVVATVSVGSTPVGVGLNLVTNRVYVANSGANTVSVVEGGSNALIASIPVGNTPRYVVVDTVRNLAYISHAADDVWVIDGVDNTVSGTIGPLGGTPGVVAVDARTQKAFVPNGATPGAVWRLDTAVRSVIGSVSVGNAPHVLAVAQGRDLLVVPSETAIQFVNGESGSVVYAILQATASRGVAIDPATGRVFLTDGPDAVVVVQY